MTCGVQLATQPGVLMLGMVNGELVGYTGCQIEDPGLVILHAFRNYISE